MSSFCFVQLWLWLNWVNFIASVLLNTFFKKCKYQPVCPSASPRTWTCMGVLFLSEVLAKWRVPLWGLGKRPQGGRQIKIKAGQMCSFYLGNLVAWLLILPALSLQVRYWVSYISITQEAFYVTLFCYAKTWVAHGHKHRNTNSSFIKSGKNNDVISITYHYRIVVIDGRLSSIPFEGLFLAVTVEPGLFSQPPGNTDMQIEAQQSKDLSVISSLSC